ncbi:hypothetical protein [Halarchaeum sp. P4]|uniref:hypothetical protein n=1 Tax=Halarchaeum sp. P4 TaxID=3421639 RepID=UPI003EBA0181
MEWPLLFVTAATGSVLMVAFAAYIWVDDSFDARERATSTLFTLAMLSFCVASASGDPVLGLELPEWTRTGGLVLELLFVALGVAVNYLTRSDGDEETAT